MKLVSSVVFALLATLPAFGQSSATADVQAAYERYRKAAETEDLPGIQAAFAPDATAQIFFTDETGRVGMAAIVDGYRQWFADCNRIRLSPKNVAVQVSSAGDVAWMTYLEDGSVVVKGRTETWKDIRSTIIFRQISGRWLIAHAHWSVAQPQVVEGTREEFREYCQMMTGRWVGDVTWDADWPGMGKRGEKATAYGEIRLAEDGHALVGRFFGGAGSWTWTAVYDAGARQIRSTGVDSGGTIWSVVFQKKDGKWLLTETGSMADGTKYDGKYTMTISDNGNVRRTTGVTTVPGKKADALNNVFRRVSK